MSAEAERDAAAHEAPPAVRARRTTWAWILVVTAVVISFAGWQLLRSGTNPSSLQRAYGFDIGNYAAITDESSEPAPDLFGPKLGGGSLSLTDYRGKVVVINLWGSWCGPCRREQPELERVWREYRERGVQFLGVNLRDNEAAALSFQREFDVTYPSFYDESSALAFTLKAQVVPTTYIVDAEKRIVFRLTGTVDGVLLRKVLDATLQREPPRG